MHFILIFGVYLLAMVWATYPPPTAQAHSYSKRSIKPEFMPSEPGKPPSCLKEQRHTYCTDPDDYPKERILDLLNNHVFDMSTMLVDENRDTRTFEEIFLVYVNDYTQPPQQDTLPPPQPPSLTDFPPPQQDTLPPPQPSSHTDLLQSSDSSLSSYSYYEGQNLRISRSVGRRAGQYRRQAQNNDGGGNLCPSLTTYIMPKAAQNSKGDWMYIVNLDDDSHHTQVVRTETCLQNECTKICPAPPGSVAVCQQQFVQTRLVALAINGTSLNQDIFWFPSFCVCKFRLRSFYE